MVLQELDPQSLLAIKFVSTTLNVKTKYADGRDIVDIKALCNKRYMHYISVVTMLEYKMLYGTSYTLLTCYKCGKLKDNSLDGFRDSQFYVADCQRYCLQCWIGEKPPGGSFKVCNRWAICCQFCHERKYTKSQNNKLGWKGRVCYACIKKINENHPKGYLEHIMQLKITSEARRWAEKFCREGGEGEDGEVDEESGSEEEETGASEEEDDE